jgi:Flp pilus assembly CpaE family ATPase
MRVRIRTREHTAETIINIERDVLSLRAAKRLFRSLQSAVPDNDLEMVVVRSRRERNGVAVGYRIDRTNMH